MQLIKLKPRNTNSADKKLNERYEKLQLLLEELYKRELPQKVTTEINTEIEKYRKVTREDIRRVAKKYFVPSNSVTLYYLPKK
mgnify:CR=1 FL=1